MQKHRRKQWTRNAFPYLLVRRQIQRGYAVSKIARLLGRSMCGVRNSVRRFLGHIWSLRLIRNGREVQGDPPINFPYLLVRGWIECGRSSVSIARALGHSYPWVLYRTRQTLGEGVYQQLLRNGRLAKGAVHQRHDWDQICSLSKAGLGLERIAAVIGSNSLTVRNCLKRSLSAEEYEKRHSIKKRGLYGPRYFRNDRGDVLASSFEAKIADYLFALGQRYSTQAFLRLGDRKFIPDFRLDGQRFIEYFGLHGRAYYDTKTEIKLAYYKQFGICCLALFPADFQGSLWKHKLRDFIYERS